MHLPCTVAQQQVHCASNVTNSHLFQSKSIDLPIHNLCPTSSRLTSIWFHVNPQSYSYDRAFFKIWPSKSKVKVIVQGDIVGVTSYRFTSLFVPCWSAFPFLRYSYFKNWPWKFKVKVMGEVKVQSHNMSLTSYRRTSLCFHVNRSSLPAKENLQKLTLKIQGQCHSSRSQSRYNALSTHISVVPSRSALPFLRYSHLKNWPKKIQGQGHGWGQSSKSRHGSNIQSTHNPFVPCQSGILFLSYDFFKIWAWKSRLKVMGEVKVTMWV